MIEIRECLFKKPLDFAPGFANIADLIRGGGGVGLQAELLEE